MTGEELTQEDVLALAGAFPVASAKTLLSAAQFPSWAIPESGFANSREFWIKIAEHIAAGVMPDGRDKILTEARRVYPWSKTIPNPSASAPAAAAATSAAGSGGRAGEDSVQADGILARDGQAGRGTGSPAVPPGRVAAVRVLVIGASPLDPDLPQVRADREAHAIEKVALPDRVVVKVVLGAEATDMRQVASFRPDIVHFVCHGTAGSLVFNDTRGESDYVAAARVADLLRFYRDSAGIRLRAVVLAACDGHTLAPYFTGVADVVIAHRDRLPDPCGVSFAEQFYTLLNDAPGPPLDLIAIAREAAQLTAQYSAACEPVTGKLILLPGDD
jgi:CHAT domain/Effector-associated domain 1